MSEQLPTMSFGLIMQLACAVGAPLWIIIYHLKIIADELKKRGGKG